MGVEYVNSPHDALRLVVPDLEDLDYVGHMIEAEECNKFHELWDLIQDFLMWEADDQKEE